MNLDEWHCLVSIGIDTNEINNFRWYLDICLIVNLNDEICYFVN